MAKEIGLAEMLELYDERPKKFSAEQVGYEVAPEGSAMRCASCLHYYRRATDGFAVCEIFRSEETDEDGVKPDWRCKFWSSDPGQVPLLEEE